MSRSFIAISGCFIVFLLLRVPAAGQTAVEAGVAAGASSTGAAGARGAGKAIGGVFRNLNDTLKTTGSTGAAKTGSPATSRSTKPSTVRKPATPAAPPPTTTYEDAREIQKGIGYEELVRRFGPPAMQIASANDAQTMSYVSHGAIVQLELQGGKVVSMVKPMETRHEENEWENW
jgi:hypothetical protein